MTTNLAEITNDALALPNGERARLAQLLWESLSEAERGPTSVDLAEAVVQATQRDAELTSGAVQHQTHDEAMRTAREAIQ